MSQAELAERLHAQHGIRLDPTAITRIERGNRTIRFNEVVALSDVLSIALYDLIRPQWWMVTDEEGRQEQAILAQSELEDLTASLVSAEVDLSRVRELVTELRRRRDLVETRLAALTAPSGSTGNTTEDDLRRLRVARAVLDELVAAAMAPGSSFVGFTAEDPRVRSRASELVTELVTELRKVRDIIEADLAALTAPSGSTGTTAEDDLRRLRAARAVLDELEDAATAPGSSFAGITAENPRVRSLVTELVTEMRKVRDIIDADLAALTAPSGFDETADRGKD